MNKKKSLAQKRLEYKQIFWMEMGHHANSDSSFSTFPNYSTEPACQFSLANMILKKANNEPSCLWYTASAHSTGRQQFPRLIYDPC